MPHGTLTNYVNCHGTRISLPSRIRLVSTRSFVMLTQFTNHRLMSQIKGSVAGLEYRGFMNSGFHGFYMTSPVVHSKQVLHGNIHPVGCIT